MNTNSVFPNSQNLYERDFHLWVKTNTQLLKNNRFHEVDWQNLIEELDSMGRREKRELKSRLIVLIEHLLKLKYWETERAANARGWRITAIEQRRQIQLLLEDSPSLETLLPNLFPDCYQKARQDTLQKYQLPENQFPSDPAFDVKEALNSDFLIE